MRGDFIRWQKDGMNWVDYAILSVIGISALVSLVRGFIKEAASLAVWFAAFVIASRFYPDLAPLITQVDDPLVRNAIAIVSLFVSTILLGAMINHLIGLLVEKSGLSGTDRVLGMVFGALRGVLVVTALLFFLDTFTQAPASQWWQGSLLIPEFDPIVQWFFDYIQRSSSFV